MDFIEQADVVSSSRYFSDKAEGEVSYFNQEKQSTSMIYLNVANNHNYFRERRVIFILATWRGFLILQ